MFKSFCHLTYYDPNGFKTTNNKDPDPKGDKIPKLYTMLTV